MFDHQSLTPNTPRSRSRSRRSTTNLANLRLAPLSTKFIDAPEQALKKTATKSPYEESPDIVFARRHPSYLHGKSAPTTPGVLSRTSSKRSLGGGLSRKDDVCNEYADGEDDGETDEDLYTYAPSVRVSYEGERAEMRSGSVPKAKSEGILFAQPKQQRRAGQKPHKHKRPSGRRSGDATPKNEHVSFVRDDWLTHTGAMTSALVQEGKGQTWLASRASSTNLVPNESEEDDDDDQYEEMAALSASTAQLQLASYDGGSPVSTRVSRWGSRYGSRSGSRKTSRLASPVGTRTPRRTAEMQSYFDDYQAELPKEDPGFLRPEERKDNYQDNIEVERLSASNSFGLGNVVDRIMNFNLFQADDRHEIMDVDAVQQNTVEDDVSTEEAKQRMLLETQRRHEEKEKLLAQPPPAPLSDGSNASGEVSGWRDAAWLLSVASKAMF